jgi:hypothetical protein
MAKVAKKTSKKIAVRSGCCAGGGLGTMKGGSAKKLVARKRAATVGTAKKTVAEKRRTAKRAVAAKPAAKKTAATRRTSPKKAVVKKRAAKKAVFAARGGATRRGPAPRQQTSKGVASAKKPGVKRSVRAATAVEAPPTGKRPSHRRKDDGTAFLPDPTTTRRRRINDDLAEGLGEEFLAGATSGASVDDARDAPVPEEDGGPFVTTSAVSQYAKGTDASNPADAEREPFPITHSERD